MTSQTSEKVAEGATSIDIVPAVDQPDKEHNDIKPHTPSRKETLSAYFTIAAAAFGLIR